MTNVQVDRKRIPIACTLSVGEYESRESDWKGLLVHVTRREPITGGVRFSLGADAPLDEVVQLAVAEHDCCRFFAFALTVDERGVALEVTAPDDAQPIIAALFGTPTD